MQLNVLDYIIIAVFLLSMLTGLRQGFVNVLGGVLSSLLALLLSFLYYDDFALLLDKSWGISSIISEFIQEQVPVLTLSPDKGLFDRGLLSIPLLGDPAGYLAHLIMPALSFLILFLISSILLKLVFTALNSLFSLGILGWANRVLGMALILLRNLLLAVLLTGVLYPLVDTASQMGWAWGISASQYMSSSVLAAQFLAFFVYLKALAVGINA
ncbi:MAG: CvpA family protein [Syntrophomonas sp.]